MSAADHGAIRDATPTTYYEGETRIPGFGDAPERCRPMKPVGFCKNAHPVLGRSSCGVRYCPDHWRDWCEDAVISMVARLAAYRETREGWEKRMVHAVASPPQDRRYSQREVYETRTEAYDAFEAAGARGGVTVTHPYRTTEEFDRMYQAADTDDGVGKWRWLRDLVEDLDGRRWENLQEFVEPSPHYHGLVAVEDLDGSDAPNGWVVENIRSMDRFDYQDRESYEDMVATAYYVLTHGAVTQGRSTSTYWGEVHPNAFDPTEEMTLTKWKKIQAEAEAAVKDHEEAVVDEEDVLCGAGPTECPHEDCEAHVVDVIHLPEYLDDDEWKADIRTQRGGRKRLRQLRGMYAWWENRTDRPPPGARSSERKLLDWFEARGERLTPEARQSFLTEPVMT